jgi:hypothetical protein
LTTLLLTLSDLLIVVVQVREMADEEMLQDSEIHFE